MHPFKHVHVNASKSNSNKCIYASKSKEQNEMTIKNSSEITLRLQTMTIRLLHKVKSSAVAVDDDIYK